MVRVRVVYVMCMSRVVVCVCEEVCGYDVGVACVHKGCWVCVIRGGEGMWYGMRVV